MSRRESQHQKLERAGQQSFAEALFFEPIAAQEVGEGTASAAAPETQTGADNPLSLDTSMLPIYRVSLVRSGVIKIDTRPQIHSPESVANILFQFLQDKDREYFVLLMLDTKNRVIGLNVVSIGMLDSTLVSAREVFKAAILANSASVVVGHNHPSGDPSPSPEDKTITKRLVEAGKLLNIEVLDHVIIGEAGKFVSLKERGMI